MTNVIPAAPVYARPVVVAGHTGPTGPSGASMAVGMATAPFESVDALVEVVKKLTKRVEALERKTGG